MAIADVFEALTAADRPYKKGKKLSETIRIMSAMKRDRHLDPDLLDLFLTSEVWREYARQYMNPGQVDEPDIDAAKALLAEAGVSSPAPVRVMYNIANPNRVNSFQLIQKSAADAGFTVVDDGQEKWSAILGDGSYDASIFGWVNPGIGVSGTPQLFRSNGGGNYSGYANTTVDSLSDQLVVELDPDKQAGIQEQIDAQLFPDAFGLPLFQSVGIDAVNSRVGGITAYNPSQSGVWWNTWEWTVSQ